MDRLQLLLAAAFEDSRQRREFFDALLKSTVLVPVLSQESEGPQVVGQTSNCLALSTANEKSVLAIFSSEALAKAWASDRVLFEEQEFARLLWLLGEEVWLHLNPGDEYGKEFSPWEIEQLRLGPEAIEDILQELDEEHEIFDVRAVDDEPLKNRLRAILEAYTDVTEGFLIELQEGSKKKILLGLVDNDISEEKRKRLELEVEGIVTGVLWGGGALQQAIFSGATPFYMRAELH